MTDLGEGGADEAISTEQAELNIMEGIGHALKAIAAADQAAAGPIDYAKVFQQEAALDARIQREKGKGAGQDKALTKRLEAAKKKMLEEAGL